MSRHQRGVQHLKGGKVASSGLSLSKREWVVLRIQIVFCFTANDQFNSRKTVPNSAQWRNLTSRYLSGSPAKVASVVLGVREPKA